MRVVAMTRFAAANTPPPDTEICRSSKEKDAPAERQTERLTVSRQ
jgi:hypothetical protein